MRTSSRSGRGGRQRGGASKLVRKQFRSRHRVVFETFFNNLRFMA